MSSTRSYEQYISEGERYHMSPGTHHRNQVSENLNLTVCLPPPLYSGG